MESKIKSLKYIKVITDDDEVFWLDNIPEHIAGFILHHKKEFLIFYDTNNFRIFHWNSKVLLSDESQQILYEDLSSYLWEIIPLLKRDLSEPLLYTNLSPVGDDYIALCKQALEGDRNFPFLSAGISPSDNYLRVLQENHLDRESFSMDIIFLLISTYGGHSLPYEHQLIKFKNYVISIVLDFNHHILNIDIKS